jgi:hypothetical protein
VLDTVPGMPRYRTLPLVLAVALLGACGSTPPEAPKIATLTSAGPSAPAAPAAAGRPGNTGGEQGVRARLDSTEQEQIKIVEQYQECLFQNGVKEVADDGGPRPAGKSKRILDESGEPKSAYVACAGKKPLPPVELDENANPNFAAQWEDNVRCLRAHGLKVHTTEPGSWTYDSANTEVPDNQAQLERDCLLEAFGGKNK